MAWYDIIIYSDFGWSAQLIPIIFTIGLSYYISRKSRDMLYIQFPMMIGMKIIFPFLNPSIVIISFALFILNLIGSNRDILGEMKSLIIRKAEDATRFERAKSTLRTLKERGKWER